MLHRPAGAIPPGMKSTSEGPEHFYDKFCIYPAFSSWFFFSLPPDVKSISAFAFLCVFAVQLFFQPSASLKAQEEADLIRGFNDTHMGILQDSQALALVNYMLRKEVHSY